MSASVLARSYDLTQSPGDERAPSGLLVPSAMGTRTHSRPSSNQRATISSMKGERARAGGPSASGMRISFATDTMFQERSLSSRKSTRTTNSLNVRLVQGSERSSKPRIRIPKATSSDSRRLLSGQESIHPRRAVEIAKSYGIPKYFLRNNSQQILTDGRMRLFGDSIWKKERASGELDRQTSGSSEVIHRLMESVSRAIESSQKRNSLKATTPIAINNSTDLNVDGENHASNASNSNRILECEAKEVYAKPDTTSPSKTGGPVVLSMDTDVEKYIDVVDEEACRPHTVDATRSVSLTGYLPKVTYKESLAVVTSLDSAHSLFPSTPLGAQRKQLTAPLRTVSDFTTISGKTTTLDEKYHNVLPRYFPVLNAHGNKQKVDLDKTSHRAKKKPSHQRLVRFADPHGIGGPNSTDKYGQETLEGVVVKRAPVQSVQRALDSHSCLGRIKLKTNCSTILYKITDGDGVGADCGHIGHSGDSGGGGSGDASGGGKGSVFDGMLFNRSSCDINSGANAKLREQIEELNERHLDC